MNYSHFSAKNSGERNGFMSDKKYPILDELFDIETDVQSATECTGLIPNMPEDAFETLGYTDIYDIPLPEIVADENENKAEK